MSREWVIRPGNGSYQRKIKTARKSHTCDECGKTIDIGEKYEFVKGKWASEWKLYSTCTSCADLREYVYDVYEDMLDDEPCYGELFKFIKHYEIPVLRDTERIPKTLDAAHLIDSGLLMAAV